MDGGERELLVVGDRVLIAPESAEDRTQHGLILPQTVVEKEQVQTGRVVAVGPGVPIGQTPPEDEPWKKSEGQPQYFPMQVSEGDYAIFLRKAAIEINFDAEEYLIVPQNAILLVMRDLFAEDEL